jgi:hypothetical protein
MMYAKTLVVLQSPGFELSFSDEICFFPTDSFFFTRFWNYDACA